MRVLHIISSSGMYGAEAVILNLSRILNERGHHCLLGTFSNSANPNLQLYERATAEGIEAHVLPCSGQIDRSTVAAIRKLAADTHADVVHAHGFKADVYVYFALRRSLVPIVSTCHTWYDTDRIVTLYGKIDRLVLRSFTRIVAVSEEVRQRLLDAGVRTEKIRIVRNGIDLRPFQGVRASLREPGSSTPIVGLIGRLAWEKGVDVYLQAAALVLKEFPSAKFVVAGEGPDRDKLEQQLDQLKIRGPVTMLGRRDDMPAVYASLNIMVSASRQEGLPMAILEGMASGAALVATTVGEVPTVVQDGRTGILVPPEDPAALATAILFLLREPAKRAAMGVAAKQLIRNEYSADRMTSDYLSIYDEAIAAKARRLS
ncbi:MAG TPA: glycosyltransferase family 4 protein [Acidobacteriaceae bacterium]|nr:glycosyltransferase family 4 protein [Acidobacteriaceae bacterium]